MKINSEKCENPGLIIPYCPVGAIKDTGKSVVIDEDECVECGQCLRARVLPRGVLYQEKLEWPRTIRAEYSNPNVPHSSTKGTGRGTEEMKTNDVTGRFKKGEIGFAVELGRPNSGAYFKDVEKVAMVLAKNGVEFEENNPTTFHINPKTGKLKDEKVGKERVLSAIVEFKTSEENAIKIYKIIKEACKDIDTVATVSIINKCENGEIPVLSLLNSANIRVRPAGKTCIGLGRPLAN